MDQYGVGFQINLLDGKVWEILRVETGFYLVSTPVGASPMEATRRWIRQVEAFPFESDQSYGIRYSHRHGEDIYTAPSRQAAFQVACNLIVEWWSELSENAQEILRDLINEGFYEAALEAWSEMVSGETIEVGELHAGDASTPKAPPRVG